MKIYGNRYYTCRYNYDKFNRLDIPALYKGICTKINEEYLHLYDSVNSMSGFYDKKDHKIYILADLDSWNSVFHISPRIAKSNTSYYTNDCYYPCFPIKYMKVKLGSLYVTNFKGMEE